MGKRLEKPRLCPPKIYSLMLDCWNIIPKSRPSYDDIINLLKPDSNQTHKKANSPEYLKVTTNDKDPK